MTDEETIEYERLKTARDGLLLTVAKLRGEIDKLGKIVNEQETNWLGVFSALAMLGFLARSKGAVFPDDVVADAFSIGKSMATELRRNSDGSSDE
ncbi:MAG: hypothetical protein WCG15_00615 [Actinomycetes bacterium]